MNIALSSLLSNQDYAAQRREHRRRFIAYRRTRSE